MKTPTFLQRICRLAGFSLPDVLVATAVMALMAAGMLTAVSALQKSTTASQHHATSQVQQSRILDYIARDLRRALTVVVDTTEGGERLTVTIPDYYDAAGKPRDPAIVAGGISYGAAGASVEISYYRRAGIFYRSVRGTETLLASDVAAFEPDFTDSGEQVVSVTVTFLPRYRFSVNDVSSLRIGTAASATTLLRNQRQ